MHGEWVWVWLVCRDLLHVKRVLCCVVMCVVGVPLLQVKMSWSSMNHGDCFLLDLGLQIWVWQGEEAGKMEKIKALEVARRIRDEERGGRAQVFPIGALVSGWLTSHGPVGAAVDPSRVPCIVVLTACR